jgi:transposase-like protein
MKKARKNYSPQEKAAILRSHLVDRVPTAQICAQFQLQHAIFYRWMKQLFENAPVALKRRPTIGKILRFKSGDKSWTPIFCPLLEIL